MQNYFRMLILVSIVIFSGRLFVTSSLSQETNRPSAQSARENAYRANNIGVAQLEQFSFKEAADSFKRALAVDPQLAIARLNLSIALFNLPDIAASLTEAKKAAEMLPHQPHPHYILGIIAKAQNRVEEATVAFQRVLQLDARDVGANVNLAQLYLQERKYEDAIKLLRVAVAAEPYNVTATYNLGIALLRSGQREEGQRTLQRFQTLRDSNYGVVIGQNYMEQGRYSEAIASTGAEAELVDTAIPEVKFTDATSELVIQFARQSPQAASVAPSPFGRSFKVAEITDAIRREIASAISGDVTLIDFDGDGDLDLFEIGPATRKLYRNDNGKFTNVTEGSGLAAASQPSVSVGAVAGDYDNDGRADLFVFGYGGLALYRNEGNGKFSNVTSQASIPAYRHLTLSVAFVDADHDGDLDIFIAGFVDLNKKPDVAEITFPAGFPAAPNLLLRNNGDGKFTDITSEAQVADGAARALTVIPTDYDNRRDIDLIVVNYGAAPILFRNLRDGTFRDAASDVGLTASGNFMCAAAGDVNKDSFTDFFFGRADSSGVFAISDGQGRFKLTDAPAGVERAVAAQFIDYDNDGLLDLIAFTPDGLKVVRNLGSRWADVSGQATSSGLSVYPARALASGDIDADGDIDLIARPATAELRIVRNESGSRNRSLQVRLVAKVSNRSNVATKVEMSSGSLRQKLETYSASPAPAPADLVFGLGKREIIDAVRVLWSRGIIQAEIEIPQAPGSQTARTITITEIDRKPSSCPFLYTWNGERFEFITDFMGGGEMGYRLAPGVLNYPDPDEYVRIRGDQLEARNRRYEIRVTNELEETLYVDRLQLVSIAHPEDTEVFPNEGLIAPPRPPFKIYATRDARPPVKAIDHDGSDALDRLTHIDRKYVDGFKLHRIRGYAEEHNLTLDLGDTGKGRVLLLLTGWTDYSFSSDNIAAHQAGLKLIMPALQVRNANGQWKTVIENIGMPVGRPQTVVVDLTDKFLSSSREVRIVTSLRIYWDQILVDTSSGDFPVRVERLEAVTADLRWRGFSAEVTPDGREPFGYDYDRVSHSSPWKVMEGCYTREGDVRELIMKTDDMFVISRPGDEIALTFDATRLAPLPRGWKRTFLLYSDGYSKEMDINSGSPDAVLPLPFHAMKSYPYSAPESYPMTRAHREYIRRYNTRVVKAPFPRVEAEIAGSNVMGATSSGSSSSK